MDSDRAKTGLIGPTGVCSSQVAVPRYDFNTHSRLGSEHDQIIQSPKIIIFEGILALHDPHLRSLFDMKVTLSWGHFFIARERSVC